MAAPVAAPLRSVLTARGGPLVIPASKYLGHYGGPNSLGRTYGDAGQAVRAIGGLENYASSGEQAFAAR
jgi:hypothetical protein